VQQRRQLQDAGAQCCQQLLLCGVAGPHRCGAAASDAGTA
jgi:hypothetical protein